jgi:lipid-A-disaccharide synthase
MSTILLSVGDASGDPYAARLVRALAAARPGTRFLGLAGDATRAAGAELVVHQRSLAVGGIVELASSLGRIAHGWRAMTRAIAARRPDLAILIDTADFNIPLARRLCRAGVPVLYYVLPQVWAWRRGRIRKIAARSIRRAVIFPFEVEEYARAGVAVEYVGHPLVEGLRDYRPAEAGPALREELGVPKEAPVLTLLPGSRRNELRYQLPLQLAAARVLAARRSGLHCILPLAPSLRADDARSLLARAGADLSVSLVESRAWDAISAADVVLAKPGTATLETALLGRPLVVAGRGHPVSAAILRRLVDVPAWAMPNLIAGANVVPEFLQEQAVPERIAEALAGLASDGPLRARQLDGLARVRERVGGEGATRRVREMAEELLGPART